METLISQHAAFFLWLFTLVSLSLLSMGGFVIKIIQKRFSEIEEWQDEKGRVMDDLDRRMTGHEAAIKEAKEDFGQVCRQIEKMDNKTSNLYDKLHEIAEENTQSHSAIIEGRTKLIERVVTLEAKTNGEIHRMTTVLSHILEELKGRVNGPR